MEVRYTMLNEIEDLEDFSKYAIDVNGHVWSFKYKKPKVRKPVWSNEYVSVKLRDDFGMAKTLYIHKLVALAFLPCNDPSRRVVHKNGDRSDNRIDNLEWVANKEDKQEELDYILHSSLVERIKQVHIAAQKKGLKVSNSYDFTTQMVENAIDSYIMQYGLRKVMMNL